jgi:hypothetical protein
MAFTLSPEAAAVLAATAERNGPAAHQLPIYPMLDDRTRTPDPYIAPLAGWRAGETIKRAGQRPARQSGRSRALSAGGGRCWVRTNGG